MKVYAGIGSRETPPDVLELFSQLAKRLCRLGWTLRTGGAPGADQAFVIGAVSHASNPFRFLSDREGMERGKVEVYLPWPSFEYEFHGAMSSQMTVIERNRPQAECFPIAEQFHPAWDRLGQGTRSLHARNCHQILGPDVTRPVLSRFVVCWTRDGAGGGGTGQALRIARHYGVEIIDAGSPAGAARVESFLRA